MFNIKTAFISQTAGSASHSNNLTSANDGAQVFVLGVSAGAGCRGDCRHVEVVLITLSCVSQLRQRTVSQQTSFDAPGLRSPAGRVRRLYRCT